MMMNLFTVFDPSTSMNLSLNWMSSLYIIMFIPSMYWLVPSRWNFIMIFLLNNLINEFKMLLSIKFNMMNIIMFMSLFLMIFLNNFLGMFSYIFVSSSHVSFSLSFSLTLWLSFMLFGWIKNTDHMFIHLVPQGTPSVLMPFMVMIESISNFMRFGSLAVRLSANMVAGHLLMSLMSSLSSKGMAYALIVMLGQSILLILELSVSMIQAYVFTVLTILYSIELS